MKLKEIKSGMVIHCKSLEEVKTLLEHIGSNRSAGQIWNDEDSFGRTDCVSILDIRGGVGHSSYEYFKSINHVITEFSDLVLPELSAEEVLDICHAICNKHKGCIGCPMLTEHCCYRDIDSDADKVAEICAQWKADHEKKEPEVETVDVCRII